MKKILIIEDNPDVRENTSEILSLANYTVVMAENGKIGVDLAQREKPDLIVCDIMMPELDGYGVLHILSKKSETADIPFIFLTAKTEKADLRKAMNLGADDYLTKPFDDTELLNVIDTRLRKHEFRLKEFESTSEGLDKFIHGAQSILNLHSLGEDKKVKSFKKKTEIFIEGDMPLSIFFVKSGNIKTFTSHPDGKDLITNLYKAGDFFGFEPMIENTPYHESAVALDDSEITIIPKNDFLMLLNGHPDVSASFISLLCKKVSDKEKQLLNLAYNSVRQRTAAALLRINELDKSKDSLRISREDLSKIVGTASESVIRVLSDFKDEGLIEIENSKINVLQVAKLEQVVRWNVAKK